MLALHSLPRCAQIAANAGCRDATIPDTSGDQNAGFQRASGFIVAVDRVVEVLSEAGHVLT